MSDSAPRLFFSFIATSLLLFLVTVPLALGQVQLHSITGSQNDDISLQLSEQQLSYEVQTKAVSVHPEQFSPAQLYESALVETALFDGKTLVTEISRVTEHSGGANSFISVNPDGQRIYVIGAWQGDRYAATILDYESNRFYTIRPGTGDSLHRLSEISYALAAFPACSTGEAETTYTEAWMAHPFFGHHQPTAPVMPNLPAQLMEDTPAAVDLLLVYTPNAATWALENEGGIELSVALKMGLSQLSLDLSDVNMELRLVGLREIDYDETTASSSVHLRRITTSPEFSFGPEFEGFLDEVHDWRDETGADLVAMLAEVNDTGGIAWLLTNPNGRPELGFSLNRIQQTTRTFTLIHEIAHNMGSAHSRNQATQPAPPNGALYVFSTGWRWDGLHDESYASVMAYNENSLAAPVFANPDISWGGAPSGALEGPFAPADNARSLRLAKHIVGNYRPTVLDGPELGTLPAALSAEVLHGEEATLTLSIQNAGESWLTWQAQIVSDEAQYGTAPLLGETQFGEDEGFSPGTYSAFNGWSLFNDNTGAGSFQITDENPSTGSQHLRLPDFDGLEIPLLLGSPEFFDTADISAVEFSYDQFLRQNTRYRAVFPLSSGQIELEIRPFEIVAYFRDVREGFGTEFFRSFNFNFIRGDYERVEVIFLAEAQEILMRYGGTEVFRYQADMIEDVPNRMFFFYGGYPGLQNPIDIDAIEVRAFDAATEWIAAPLPYAGSAEPGTTDSFTFELRSTGLEPGGYEKDIRLLTNDPERTEISIPVSLSVIPPTSLPGEPEHELAQNPQLLQNYPNPFNPTTTISFILPEAGEAQLEVFNLAGQRVATLVNGELPSGTHQVRFDASALSSGVYLYRLHSAGLSQTRSMVLVK
ncbi:Por secretion system C-terminal sorting domain-containing protein [Cyclonatronum proteinivorum]|uniref:Por secretion system C-terminal sorting domain-containing protein n=1 Tax=Cyclonatronum proteinivorum TaxID=1457365 RepID=A0A345UPG8_9BACT|nr:zinc-dependent metalloprotease [Cyclonatronum proteinivorum]AXJ02370.1 Por secretion system C-terminal sorting domain-containing protein [Cyclonatronum proteinivorum]